MTNGQPTPRHRHRTDRNQDQWCITPGFIKRWLAIIIILGAHFGSDKKTMWTMWQRPSYGISIPYVQNTMQWDAFEFMRQHIHFADNYKQPKTTDKNYNPLFKVTYILKEVGLGIRQVWHAGKDVLLDKSMIKYCSHVVALIQYMPANLIKHGTKVFCLCCVVTAVMLAFEVYCGKDNNKTNNTMVDICERLIHEAGLVHHLTGGVIPRQTIYSDNYCTSVKLVKHLYESYWLTIVGTVVPTKKTSQSNEDLVFVKLSNGARNKLRRGWFCDAYMKKKLLLNLRSSVVFDVKVINLLWVSWANSLCFPIWPCVRFIIVLGNAVGVGSYYLSLCVSRFCLLLGILWLSFLVSF